MVNIADQRQARVSPAKAVSGVENELHSCLIEQGIVFQSAVEFIEQLEYAAHQRTLGQPESVSRLQQSLELVVAAQQKVAVAYAAFSESHQAPSEELRISMANHETQLRVLISRIDQLKGVFEKVRADLTPQVDAESRRRNMQAAYQKSLRTI